MNRAGQRIAEHAPAKINLFLHVGDKRPDKFHELESLVVFSEFGDTLTFEDAADLALSVTGAFGRYVPPGEDNLIFRAARLLSDGKAGLGAAMTLEKNIPVAAGVGGGSADAAAALRGLNALWGLGHSENALAALGAQLGSDVPACVLSRSCWMAGRGERIAEVPSLPRIAMVLVNPGIAVPTGPVFASLNARTGTGAIAPPQRPIESLWELVRYLDSSENDLEAPACAIAPIIDDVLGAIAHEPGCVMAQMSGSGATCFGLFDGEDYAKGAADRIARDHNDWWAVATHISGCVIGNR